MVTPIEILQDQLRELKSQISSGDVRVEDCVARLRSNAELEVTESHAEVGSTISTLNARKLGVSVSVDDFGTLYALDIHHHQKYLKM